MNEYFFIQFFNAIFSHFWAENRGQKSVQKWISDILPTYSDYVAKLLKLFIFDLFFRHTSDISDYPFKLLKNNISNIFRHTFSDSIPPYRVFPLPLFGGGRGEEKMTGRYRLETVE